ncbi:P-loop containing nucleoside triphosphate hydrolase protein [Peziza echinospora]|nr:P-loop containing nucleoside triphosphate hydrolase protein [Peziza echinospora]
MLQTHLRTLPRKCVLRHAHHTRTLSSAAPSVHITPGGGPGRPKWGIFSDMHFQQQDLPRIIQTSQWITDAFRREGVSQIFCLGDVLNTRENVNVQALSATSRFFDQLKGIAPVHIVLGNHDMNLKHSGTLSSLDFFDMQELRESCALYREMAFVDVEGVQCLMVPWAENHANIVDKLGEISAERKKETILFGHLAVSGAIQQPALSERSRFRTHSGVLKGRHLAGFRSAYLGHFHHHQRLSAGDGPANVWYVGAPMQHHFGDKGDDRRGLVLMDPLGEPAELMLVQNPEWDVFRDITLDEIRNRAAEAGEPDVLPKLPFDVRGKRMSIRCSAIDAPEFERWRKRLMDAGAGDVRRSIEVIQVGRKPVVEAPAVDGAEVKDGEAVEQKTEDGEKMVTPEEETFKAPTTATFIEALPAFLKTIPQELNIVAPEQHAAYIATAARLMNLSDTMTPTGPARPSNTASSSLPIFHATLRSLSITNFFSVQGTLTIPFSELAPGTWFLTGPNGAGKSTVLEAVVWCLFGQVLRSDMAAADPVNDVIRKNCCVSIEFENGYKIERFRAYPSKSGGARGPGLKLYKDGIEVTDFERGEMSKTQEALQRDIIGCDFATFTKSVVFGDEGVGAGNFLSLGSVARRDVLEELLGISSFEGYLHVVREERRALAKEHLQLKARAGHMESTLAGITNERDALQESLPPKEVTKAQLERSLLALAADEQRLEQDREAMDREQGEMLKWNHIYESVLRQDDATRRLGEQLAIKREARDNALATLETVRRIKATAHPQSSLLQRLEADGITEAYLITVLERERDINTTLASISSPISQLERSLRSSQAALDNLLGGRTMEQVAALAHRDSGQNTTSLEAAMEAHSNLMRRTQDLNARRNTLTASLTRLTTELTLSNSHLLHLNSQIDTNAAELEASTARMHELDELTRIVLFWESAFNKKSHSTSNIPNMRQYLISTSINELNTLIKTNMAILTTPTISADGVEEISRAPDIPLAFTPDLLLDPPSSYGKRSSGQRKRNNLAVLFALFQLIRQKSRFRSDFIMLDEVFDALDQSGQVQASELISRITTEGDVKHVLVVTHSESLPDEVFKVGGGGGSRVMKVEIGERGTEIFEPQGRIGHSWTNWDSEVGVPEIETGVTERRTRGVGRKNKVNEEGEELKEGEVRVSARGKRGPYKKRKPKEVVEGEPVAELEAAEVVVAEKKKRGRKKKVVADAEEAA